MKPNAKEKEGITWPSVLGFLGSRSEALEDFSPLGDLWRFAGFG
jgi:hypothetical protein